MFPNEIDEKHRKRAREIVETAQHFVVSEEELVELIAEGLQATENIKNGIVLQAPKIKATWKTSKNLVTDPNTL